jgi:DNA-binding transcriptional MerR regulator
MKIDVESFMGKRDLGNARELCERLTQKMFIGTDTGVPYRNLNHWGKLGLFDDDREDTKNWRRFSFVEFIWIRVIDELRNVGLDVDAIKALKEALLKPSSLLELSMPFINIYGVENLGSLDKSEETKQMEVAFWEDVFSDSIGDELTYTWLQLMIATAITKRCPVIMAVFTNGDYFTIEEVPGFVLPEEHLDRLSFETHVRISITGIVRKFLASDPAIERIGMLQILESNKQTVLEIIKSGQFKSVKIHFKSAKMTDLELVQSQDIRKKIVDILAKGKYQTITIEQHQGQTTKIENTIKHKFPK